MPRFTSSLILSSDPYFKSEKTKKSFQASSMTSVRNSHSSLVLFSIVCLAIGISTTIFSLYSLSHSKSIPVLRCAGAQDTLRPKYISSMGKSRRVGGVGRGRGVDRPKFLGFVGIQTGFSSADRRDALRSTWLPSNPDDLVKLEQATGLAFRFVIGRSKDAKKMAELHKEVEDHKDFMLIDVDEEYARPPHKTLAFFKDAYELFEADYYVKAHDDIYLRPDRLGTLLAKERTGSMTYIGCMKKGPVITDPKMKWYESQGHLIGNEYFLHAYGPMYILSAEVVASLANARNNSLRMFSNEDVTIGSWMLSFNVRHEDNRAICDPHCSPTSIAVWDIPKCSGLCNAATRLQELHQTDMCSKSPTLPADDDDD